MNIVVLDGATLNPGDNPWRSIEELAAPGAFKVFERTGLDEIVPRAKNCQVVLTNKTPLDAAVINALPNLELICVLATGVNVVDMQAAKQAGVLVCNVPEYAAQAVSQFVMTQILYFCHRVDHHDQRIREGAWQACGEFSFWETSQVELAGLTLGVVGFGSIGQAVARLAQAFGMKVVVATRSIPAMNSHVRFCTFSELLGASDIVSLHCPLTPDTQHMIHADTLSQMKTGAWLINTARGDLVHEPSLVQALQSGKLGGAALDVVADEPMGSNNALLSAPNLLVTPHMAWSSLQARRRLMATTAANIKGFQAKSPINVAS